MVDVVDKATRSRMMAGIRAKDTKPEIGVRKALYGAGYRFRIHVAALPGKPDIVIRRLKAIVFVHGCFWHRHVNCKYAYTPRSNQSLWKRKFLENLARDKYVANKLRRAGWHVYVIWECQVHEVGLARLNTRISKLEILSATREHA
jgi:DNA mismatch endonuclease, patch repair protein